MIYMLNLEFIVIDCEESLINAINNVFTDVQIILCYFHYKV